MAFECAFVLSMNVYFVKQSMKINIVLRIIIYSWGKKLNN